MRRVLSKTIRRIGSMGGLMLLMTGCMSHHEITAKWNSRTEYLRSASVSPSSLPTSTPIPTTAALLLHPRWHR